MTAASFAPMPAAMMGASLDSGVRESNSRAPSWMERSCSSRM